jgi:hypothetical protein
MKPNLGAFDRIVRIFAGYMILSAFFLIDGNARWLTLIGIVPLLSGPAGSCPAYLPLGIDTRPAAAR